MAQRLVDWGKAYDKSRSSTRGISAGSSENNSSMNTPGKYLNHKQLLALGVDYGPLPLAQYREG